MGDVEERLHLAGELDVVLLLLLVETDVLQDQDLRQFRTRSSTQCPHIFAED